MLKKPFKQDTTLNTNLFVFSEDDASDRDFVFEKILNIESLSNINSIVDFESIEYKPMNETLEFNIFFLRYLLKGEIEEIKDYTEAAFSAYSDKVLSLNTSIKSELFEIRNDENLMEPQFDTTVQLTRNQINDAKPYIVDDPLVELRKRYPAKAGRPHFYNTFAFPFWDKKDVWTKLKYGFNNKTYTYNSFLIIEIYDAYEIETQKKITTTPVYVSDRYLFKEKRDPRSYNVLDNVGNVLQTITIEGVNQKRPVFNLTEGVDGYSFFFLKKYTKSDFYVKFYFWDALNGKKIQFIPSGKNNTHKKWLQDVETFDQKNLYLKYELDYTTKKYKIYDINPTTGSFDVEIDKIDLYEFAYDDYWSQFIVKNDQPSNISVTSSIVTYPDILPLKTKLNGTFYLTDTQYVTIANGFRVEKNAVDPVIQTTTEYISDDSGYYPVEKHYVAYGNYYGYFLQISDNINIKTLGLLNIRDIHCGDTAIRGSRKSLDPITLKNVNPEKTFIIDSLVLENVTFSSNEQIVNLSTTANLSYNVSNGQNVELYGEAHVLPKPANALSLSVLDSIFSNNFEEYKNLIHEDPYNYNYEGFKSNNQKFYANMLLLADNVNVHWNSSKPQDYNPTDFLQKLKTESSYKKESFALTVNTNTKRLAYEEQMVTSFSLVFGQNALYYSGIIKELNVKGSLVINYRESDVAGEIKKITIPIDFNVK